MLLLLFPFHLPPVDLRFWDGHKLLSELAEALERLRCRYAICIYFCFRSHDVMGHPVRALPPRP